ncbi:hypothetical protein OROMI_024695 [Orobanche minor]
MPSGLMPIRNLEKGAEAGLQNREDLQCLRSQLLENKKKVSFSRRSFKSLNHRPGERRKGSTEEGASSILKSLSFANTKDCPPFAVRFLLSSVSYRRWYCTLHLAIISSLSSGVFHRHYTITYSAQGTTRPTHYHVLLNERSSNTAISIDILRKLKHENIISMLDSFESLQEFCVVTEFTQGEIFEILRDDTCLPEEQVQAIAKQLCESIALSPLKPYNSLGHETRKHTHCAGSVVKLCDFGFAPAMSANTVVLQSIKGKCEI